MSRPLPTWIAWAERAYALTLFLYPARLRELHGEDMRQAFRDRCRDFAAGRVSAWRLFGHEFAIDSLRAAGGAHLEAGIGAPGLRHAVLFALLLGAGMLLLLREAYAPRLLEAQMAAVRFVSGVREDRALRRDESSVRELASALLARPAAEDRALAAWLLAANATGRTRLFAGSGEMYPSWHLAVLSDDGYRAQRAADAAMGARSAFAVAALAASCQRAIGCVNSGLLNRLGALEPDNAFAAMEQFKDAARRADDAGMSAALASAARASYYENHEVALQLRALRAATALRPGDDAFLAGIARRTELVKGSDLGEWNFDLRPSCMPAINGEATRERFINRHPERRGDCVAVARALTHGTDWVSPWLGWKLRERLGDASKAESEVALAALTARERTQPGSESVNTAEHAWRPWSDAEWAQWARQLVAGHPKG